MLGSFQSLHRKTQQISTKRKNLFSGSFMRHKEIIFLKDLPYFFTMSLSAMPVSRVGGSFCSVSIKTWRRRRTLFHRGESRVIARHIGRRPHLHRRVFVIGRGPRGELNGRDPKTPDIRFEIVALLLQRAERDSGCKRHK